MTAPDRLRATYDLVCAPGEEARAKALDIAREQTVEMPEGTPPGDVEARVLGVIERLDTLPDGRSRVVISYDVALVDGAAPQLLNLLFGNISMKRGIRLVGLDLPEPVLRRFGGPRFGIEGVRERCGAPDGPLLCAVIKPVGLAPAELAVMAERFARAGAHLVKDDHSLADQASAPFRERTARCAAAVARANDQTGGRTVYLPNVSGTVDGLRGRLELAREVGCGGVLVNAIPQGLDAVRLAGEIGLIALSHPTMAGAFFGRDHGIAPEVLLGDVFRLVGSDGVIYPNPEGRFPHPLWTVAMGEAINRRLREPLGGLRPAFAAPGGGVEATRVPEWLARWGPDTLFLVGGSLYAQGDYEAATRRLLEAMRTSYTRMVAQTRA